MPLTPLEVQQIHAIVQKYAAHKKEIIRVLEQTQELLGCIPEEAQRLIAQLMQMPYQSIAEKVRFYSHFTASPKGKYQIGVCMGTACKQRCAILVFKAFEEALGVHLGETTPDGRFFLTMHRCMVACHGAPVVVINSKRYQNVQPAQVARILQEYQDKA